MGQLLFNSSMPERNLLLAQPVSIVSISVSQTIVAAADILLLK
jgi:hypothetical protein